MVLEVVERKLSATAMGAIVAEVLLLLNLVVGM